MPQVVHTIRCGSHKYIYNEEGSLLEKEVGTYTPYLLPAIEETSLRELVYQLLECKGVYRVHMTFPNTLRISYKGDLPSLPTIPENIILTLERDTI